MEVGGEIVYLLLHCHHQNDSWINVSLTVRDKVTRQCPQTTIFEENGELKQIRTEVPGSAYQPTALPLGQTGGSHSDSTDSRVFMGADERDANQASSAGIRSSSSSPPIIAARASGQQQRRAIFDVRLSFYPLLSFQHRRLSSPKAKRAPPAMAVITGELWPLARCFTASGSCKLCESFSRPAPSRAVLCENCNPLTAPFVNELQMAARRLRVARYTPGSKRPGGVKQAQRRKTKDSLRMLRLKSRALKFQKREKCLHTVRSLLLFFSLFFCFFSPAFLFFCPFFWGGGEVGGWMGWEAHVTACVRRRKKKCCCKVHETTPTQ